MLEKTSAVVLHQLKYSDSSLIVHLYSEKFGRISAMARGVRKGKTRNVLFQPLTILDLELYRKESSGLASLREARMGYPLSSVFGELHKSTMALFIAEVLYRCLRQEEADPELFAFVRTSIQLLEEQETDLSAFHLVFLIKLTKFLGFYPDETTAGNPFFNLNDGIFQKTIRDDREFLDESTTRDFKMLLSCDFNSLEKFKSSRQPRGRLLQGLIDYYTIHIPGMGEIRSHKILEEIFND